MNKKILSLVLICVLILSFVCVPAEAATGYEAYAVYRDGVSGSSSGNGSTVVGEGEWHAGIVNTASSYTSEAFIHATKGSVVDKVNWDTFIVKNSNATYKNEFMGYYRPMTTMSKTDKNLVLATARALASSDISYTAILQMDYPTDNPKNQSYVYVADITDMRCDGVVEYSYESNGIRIYGNVVYWDISVWNAAYRDSHGLWLITPSNQAEDYMILVDETRQ